MHKIVFTVFLFLSLQSISFAQDTLPKVTVLQAGKKVVISWTNPYTNIANINIQRSPDSLKNFKTIGSVLNVKAGSNGFVDAKEFIPSQYYRLFISFEGGSYIFTASHKPGIDTSKAAPLPVVVQEIPVVPVKTYFVPSKHVYTGKDNNIIIALPDTDKNKYSVKFFEEDGTFLFELKKINENYLTLDKVNFLHAGLFSFELYENRIIIEKHKVYIPKDGKPMPALDPDGHEIKN